MTRKMGAKKQALAALFGALMAAGVAVLGVLGGPAQATLPGSNGAIAFSSSRDGGFNIYRMNSDGFGQTRLTETPGYNFYSTWSADGRTILFDNRQDFDVPAEVWAMNADGSGERNLTNASKADGTPAAGPGGRVAFASTRVGDQLDVYVMTLGDGGQTTGLTRLTNDPAWDGMPVLSPDGRRVVFVSDRDGDNDLYLMRLAPEGPKNVPVKLTRNTPPDPGEGPAMNDTAPDFSPDGRQIVFTSDRTGNYEVFRMKPQPEGPKNRPVNLSRSPGSFESDPTYSPDGRKIAFSTDRDGNGEIYSARASDGANPRNLTNHPSADFYPAWQPQP